MRNEGLTVEVSTECAHCTRKIEFTIDSELRLRASVTGPVPLVFEPQVNWEAFNEPNIIHAY